MEYIVFVHGSREFTEPVLKERKGVAKCNLGHNEGMPTRTRNGLLCVHEVWNNA